MVRETYVPDGSGSFLPGDPVNNSHCLKTFPLGDVGKVVHEIVIDPVCPKPGQFLVEILVQRSFVTHQVLGKFGRYADLVPDPVALENLAQGRFAAGVDICRVIIVHACPVGGHQLPLSLLDVNTGAFAAESHAAVPEDG